MGSYKSFNKQKARYACTCGLDLKSCVFKMSYELLEDFQKFWCSLRNENLQERIISVFLIEYHAGVIILKKTSFHFQLLTKSITSSCGIFN